MKNKKGFTLIELLAIIVILAIIAVITVPIILNVIDESKKGAAKDSAYGYKNAINQYYATEVIKNGMEPLNGEYTVTEEGKLTNGTETYDIPFIGTKPTGGNLIYENNILMNGCIVIDEYKIKVTDGEIENAVKGECEKVVYEIINQKETNKLSVGDEIKIKTENFYVVSSNSNDTVLLAKYNLNVGNGTQDETYGKIGMQNEYAIGMSKATIAFATSKYWDGQVGNNLTYPGTYNSENHPYVYDNNSILYNYVELYKQELEKFGAEIKEARILKYQEFIALGCVNGYPSKCPTGNEENSFVSKTSYWTGSPTEAESIWTINSSGQINSWKWDNTTQNGVRPVIVIDTSDIL